MALIRVGTRAWHPIYKWGTVVDSSPGSSYYAQWLTITHDSDEFNRSSSTLENLLADGWDFDLGSD